MTADINTLLETLATKPISDKAPTGSNIRLEPNFEAIESQLSLMDSLTSDIPTDWDEVQRLCKIVLASESKDLLVACYLTRALCEKDLLQGLDLGLGLNLKLMELYWENCFPAKKRARGRAAPYVWLVERLDLKLEAYQPGLSDLAQLKQIVQKIRQLDEFLLEQLGDVAPPLNEFEQVFKRWVSGLEREQVAQEARAKSQAAANANSSSTASPQSSSNSSGAAPGSPSQGSAAPVPRGAISSEAEYQAYCRNLQESLRTLCLYLRENQPTNAESFRINRFLTWLGVNALPGAKEGVTQLRPLPADMLKQYETLLQLKNYNDLIPQIENSISRAPFWLDGHYWMSTILEDMGAVDAKNAVNAGVRDFVKRLPGVVNLKFVDNTPFANDETRSWLSMEVMAESGNAQSDLALPLQGEETANWESAYEQALVLQKEKKMKQALALFQDGCMRSISKREQIFWRFNQARFCFESKQFDLAIPLLERIDQQLQNNQLDDWEPAVTTKIIELLLRCYKNSKETEALKQRIEALHARLCRYDLALAFELSANQ